jgi:hypothetical protein
MNSFRTAVATDAAGVGSLLPRPVGDHTWTGVRQDLRQMETDT